jgi:predicted ATP-grasp superfamily ATP-dependent carboligase
MRYVLMGLSTRGVAESAVRAKKDCVTVDFFGDLDQEQICKGVCLRREYEVPIRFNPFLFLKAADSLEFSHLVYVAPLENYPEILETISKKCVIVGNDAGTVKRVRDWRRLYHFCKENGILYPETFDGLDYVVKPKKSGGGVRIQRLSSYVVQKYVRGEHFSASFLGNGSESVMGSVNEQLIGRKEFGARKFWYCGNITPVFVDNDLDEICEKLVKEFRLKGSCGIDFVVNDGLYVMEVNPRIQATLEIVERSCGVNLFVLHEHAVAGTLGELNPPKRTWGKAIIYAEEDVTMPDTSEWLDYGWIKDIPHPLEHILKSEPICTVIADGADRDDCFEHLVEKTESVRSKIRK